MVAFSKQVPGQELGAPVVLGINAPKGAPVVDPQQFLKLATRVATIIKKDRLSTHPVRLMHGKVVVGINNREGAPPNVQHVHHGILKGIREKGFCSDRPQVGICIKYESPEGKNDSWSTTSGSPHRCSRLSTRRQSTGPWLAPT